VPVQGASLGLQQRVRAAHVRMAWQLATASQSAISQEQLSQLQSANALHVSSVRERNLHSAIPAAL
jgi:hypothetical protein